MIQLNEDFYTGDFGNYLGKNAMLGIKNYLKKFKEYDESSKTFLSFPDKETAFKVSKQIVIDAQTSLANGQSSPAVNYIMYRCAPSIIEGFKKYVGLRAATTVHLDVTGTGEFQGYVDAVYKFITDEDGLINFTDLSKFSYGDILDMFNYRLGLDLGNLHNTLLTGEHFNGVNYAGVRSKSVVKHDMATDKYYDIATGKEITKKEAKALKAKASIRKRGISLDAPINAKNGEVFDTPADGIIARYGVGPASGGLSEPEKEFFDKFEDSGFIDDWKECCLDTEWTRKDNIKAKILKTILKDMAENKIPDQKTFIEKCGLNKTTFRNYMGLSSGTYEGVTIPMLLDDYGLKIPEIVKYFTEYPEKMNYMLDMLPGGLLHEALKRHMSQKRLKESLIDDILMEFELFR